MSMIALYQRHTTNKELLLKLKLNQPFSNSILSKPTLTHAQYSDMKSCLVKIFESNLTALSTRTSRNILKILSITITRTTWWRLKMGRLSTSMSSSLELGCLIVTFTILSRSLLMSYVQLILSNLNKRVLQFRPLILSLVPIETRDGGPFPISQRNCRTATKSLHLNSYQDHLLMELSLLLIANKTHVELQI